MRGDQMTIRQIKRGDGTTTAQLHSLRKGDVFLTGNKSYAEMLVRKHDCDRGIRIIHRAANGTDDRMIYDQLRALRREAWIEVDHYGSSTIKQPLYDFIYYHDQEAKNAATTESSERS